MIDNKLEADLTRVPGDGLAVLSVEHLRVTDNGDGTLTILILATGNAVPEPRSCGALAFEAAAGRFAQLGSPPKSRTNTSGPGLASSGTRFPAQDEKAR